MAPIAFFHYLPRRSPLHSLDPRLKLPLFILTVSVSLHCSVAGLVLETVAVAAAAGASRLPLSTIARDLLPFSVLLALMCVAEAWSISGIPLLPPLPFTREGLIAGAELAWRLALLVALGALLAGTTSVTLLQSAVVWYLRPVLGLAAGRIATMMGLTITLIPLVFESYRQVSEAQASRGSGTIRNPLRRITLLARPLLIATFSKADTIASAMESRCYTDSRSYPTLRVARFDVLLAGAILLVQGAVLLAGRLL